MKQLNLERALILFSGGLDSTICLHYAKASGYKEIHVLALDYNQRNLPELRAARTIAERGQQEGWISSFHCLYLPMTLFSKDNPLTGKAPLIQYSDISMMPKPEIEQTFVPGRNLLFLTIAAMRAYERDCKHLFIGVAGMGGYPDCSHQFVTEVEAVINTAFAADFHIVPPLLYGTRVQALRRAHAEWPDCWRDIADSYSCYTRGPAPCLHCHACLTRKQAFEEAMLDDPAIKPNLIR